MDSPFSLSIQDKAIEAKILVALERISEAFRVLLWKESKEHSLSPIQIQILIFLSFHPASQCTISYLAQEFNLTKATVSDSVKALLQKKLIIRKASVSDSRSYSVSLTKSGKKIADNASYFATPIEDPLSTLSAGQKEAMFAGLIRLIRDLNQQGIISTQRMCQNCANHELRDGEHYCKLLQTRLMPHELRLDCSEHEFAA